VRYFSIFVLTPESVGGATSEGWSESKRSLCIAAEGNCKDDVWLWKTAQGFSQGKRIHCIVLYLYIYIALHAVRTNRKRFQCERPRENRVLIMQLAIFIYWFHFSSML